MHLFRSKIGELFFLEREQILGRMQMFFKYFFMNMEIPINFEAVKLT